MAYKLLDQNGNKMIINGMNKGYIKVPYNFQGLEWYNVNTTNYQYDLPFYRDVKCIYINGNMFKPYNGTTHKFIIEAYSATQIKISGRRWTEGFDHYEIYLNNELVSTGVFPDKVNTDIYVINKEENTSVILSGEWDSTNSKYIYNITTNAIIHRENSYQWLNPLHTGTITLTVGAGQEITTTQYYNRIVLPSLNTIKSKVASKIGSSSDYVNVTKVEIDLSTLYWLVRISGYSEQRPYFSLSTSNPSYFGSGTTRSSGSSLNTWGSYNLDITRYLKNSTVELYGYSYEVYYSPHTYESFQSSSGYYPAFSNSSGSGKPTFTIIVTYEY